MLEHKSGKYIELHVREVKKRGTRIEIENSGYDLAGFDHFKSEILAELESFKNSLEDMVHWMELTNQ